jgi:hypothetical protein
MGKKDAELLWTNPQVFPELIEYANFYYGMGLSDQKIDGFKRTVEKLEPETDNLSPISVSLMGKGDIASNWNKQYAWLQDRMSEIGHEVYSCIYAEEIELKAQNTQGPSLEVVRFNLKQSEGGVSYRAPKQLRWAGLEVMTMLCLSPQCFTLLNGKVLPMICANGARFATAFVPIFLCENGEPHIQARWVNHNGPDKSESGFWSRTQIPTIATI